MSDQEQIPDDADELMTVEVVDGELVERSQADGTQSPTAERLVGAPKALFYACLLLLVPAVLAAAAADGTPPAVALQSEWLYRAEVGLLIYGLGYLLLLVFVLAYFGKSIGRLDLPSGAGLDLPAGGDLTAAAQQTGSIAAEMRESFSKQNEINRALLQRLNQLDAPADSDVEHSAG